MKALKNITNNKKIVITLVIGLVIAVLVILLIAVVADSDDADVDFINDSTQVLNSGIVGADSILKPMKNVTIVKEFDDKISESQDCSYRLAKIYSEKRLYDKSNIEFDAAQYSVESIFKDSVTYFQMKNYWNLGNYEKVVLLGRTLPKTKILEVKYIVDRSVFELAINHSDTLLLNTKLREYTKLQHENLDNYDFLLTYAYLLYVSGADYELSDRYLNKAIALNSQRDFYPYSLKGKSFLHKKEYRKSIEYFNKLLESYPYSYSIYLYLGKSYFSLNQYEKALEDFEISLAIMKSDVGYYNCGIVYVELGNDSLAFDMFKKSYRYNSTNIENLYEIVKIYAKTGRIDKSILLCETIFDIINVNYGKPGVVHKKYLKFLIKLYLEKDTDKFKKKTERLVYELCDIDPKDHESLQLYEDIHREIFRVKINDENKMNKDNSEE